MGYFSWVRPPMVIGGIAIFGTMAYLFNDKDKTITVETRPEQEWPRLYLAPEAPQPVETLDEI